MYMVVVILYSTGVQLPSRPPFFYIDGMIF